MAATTQLQAVAADRSRAEAVALACLEASPFIEGRPWRFSWFESPGSLFSEGLTRAHQEQALEPGRAGPWSCPLCREDLNVTVGLDPYLSTGKWTMGGNSVTEAHLDPLREPSDDLQCDFWESKAPWDQGGCEYLAWDPGRHLSALTRKRLVSHYGFPHGFGNTWLATAQLDHDSEPSKRGPRRRRWLYHYRELAASVGWWVVFGDSVLLVPKPVSMSYDAEGNVHGLAEPAVVYPDGWGFYAFHGRALPDWSDDPGEPTLRRILTVGDPELCSSTLELVDDQALEENGVVDLIRDEPDSQVCQALIGRFGPERLVPLVGSHWVWTKSGPESRLSMLEMLDDKTLEEAGVAQLVLLETNVEVRQKLLARFGPDRVAEELGARRLAKDRFGELWVVPAQVETIPSNFPHRQDRFNLVMDRMKFVRVVDATPRPNGSPIYWLPVPLEMTSAREAVAWTFDMGTYEYRPEVET